MRFIGGYFCASSGCQLLSAIPARILRQQVPGFFFSGLANAQSGGFMGLSG